MTRYYSMPEVAHRLSISPGRASYHALHGHTFGAVPAQRIGIGFVVDADLFDSEFGVTPTRLLSMPEVADRLGFTRRTATRKATRDGSVDGLPVHRIGHRFFVTAAAVGE